MAVRAKGSAEKIIPEKQPLSTRMKSDAQRRHRRNGRLRRSGAMATIGAADGGTTLVTPACAGEHSETRRAEGWRNEKHGLQRVVFLVELISVRSNLDRCGEGAT